MFGFLKKDPKKQLRKKYEKLLAEAMQAQRKGDMKLFAQLTEQNEAVLKELEALEAL